MTKVKPGKHLLIQRILRKKIMDTLLQESILFPAHIASKE